eukprot:9575312-Alexandrium_andersonii.AAC.1
MLLPASPFSWGVQRRSALSGLVPPMPPPVPSGGPLFRWGGWLVPCGASLPLAGAPRADLPRV